MKYNVAICVILLYLLRTQIVPKCCAVTPMTCCLK